MKIFVTGNAGSGKSTTARHISEERGIPYYSLDGIVWEAGWKKATAEERKRKVRELVAKENWVIDGVDMDVLAVADKVIFLDISRATCYKNVIKRNYKYLFRSRPELPPNCPEILIIPKLVKIVWKFPTRIRPLILGKENRKEDAQLVRIKRQSDIPISIESLK